jgi:Family of unknown function (DUF6464)
MKQGKFVLTAAICTLITVILCQLLVFLFLFSVQSLGNFFIPASTFISYLIYSIYSSSKYRRQSIQKHDPDPDSTAYSRQRVSYYPGQDDDHDLVGYSSPSVSFDRSQDDEYRLDSDYDDSDLPHPFYDEIYLACIGDPSCIYNAHSPLLRCAVNPEIDSCENCQHFERSTEV